MIVLLGSSVYAQPSSGNLVLSQQTTQASQATLDAASKQLPQPISVARPRQTSQAMLKGIPDIVQRLPFFNDVQGFITSFDKPIGLFSYTYKNGDTLNVVFNPNPDFRTLTTYPSIEFTFVELQSHIRISTRFYSLGTPLSSVSSNLVWKFG